MDQKKFNLQESFEKGIRNIFQVAAFIILAGNLLDLLEFAHSNKTLLISNITTLLIISFFLGAYYLKIIPHKICFSVLIYTAIANIYLGKYISSITIISPIRVDFFLRDSLFIMLLIPLAAFTLNKLHAIVIGISYIVMLVVFSIYINNSFLNNSALLLVLVTAGFVGLTYYLVDLLEKALSDVKEHGEKIEHQNEDLIKANNLLNEKQRIIKEQSGKLMTQADELKFKNKELIRLVDSKNMFFSIIAHDLKNPFSIIIGYAELLKKKYQTLTDDKKSKYIEIIETTSVKTHNLLENLLNWSRTQSGTMHIEPDMFIINDVINEIIDLYSENLNSKSLEIEFSPEFLYEVYADREMISTVIRNLVSNAIKFSYKNNKITITLFESNDSVQCKIRDYGVGIENERLKYIFNIDYHLSTKGTDGELGSGLGLILCKIFMEKNKGILYTESKPNFGSCFSIVLPNQS